jgi:hypothetical protein
MDLDESNLLPSAVHPMAERIERKLRESMAIEHFVSVLLFTLPPVCVGWAETNGGYAAADAWVFIGHRRYFWKLRVFLRRHDRLSGLCEEDDLGTA